MIERNWVRDGRVVESSSGWEEREVRVERVCGGGGGSVCVYVCVCLLYI